MSHSVISNTRVHQTIFSSRFFLEQPSAQTVVSRIDLKHIMNTYTNFQPGTSINNNLYNSFDQNLNKPNYESNYENQYPSNKPNYESGFGQHFTPSNPYGMDGIVPGSSSPSFPNQGMPSPMLPPPFPVTQRPPPTAPPTPQPPPVTTQAPIQTQPAFVVPSSDVNSICGTRHSETEITPFIFGGEDTMRGNCSFSPTFVIKSDCFICKLLNYY